MDSQNSEINMDLFDILSNKNQNMCIRFSYLQSRYGAVLSFSSFSFFICKIEIATTASEFDLRIECDAEYFSKLAYRKHSICIFGNLNIKSIMNFPFFLIFDIKQIHNIHVLWFFYCIFSQTIWLSCTLIIAHIEVWCAILSLRSKYILFFHIPYSIYEFMRLLIRYFISNYKNIWLNQSWGLGECIVFPNLSSNIYNICNFLEKSETSLMLRVLVNNCKWHLAYYLHKSVDRIKCYALS